MKTHHVVSGWYTVEHIGKRAGVVTQQYAAGNEGAIFGRGVGPLDMRDWFHRFVEANPGFREGEPTDIGEYLNDLVTMSRAAGYPVPAESTADHVAHKPATV